MSTEGLKPLEEALGLGLTKGQGHPYPVTGMCAVPSRTGAAGRCREPIGIARRVRCVETL